MNIQEVPLVWNRATKLKQPVFTECVQCVHHYDWRGMQPAVTRRMCQKVRCHASTMLSRKSLIAYFTLWFETYGTPCIYMRCPISSTVLVSYRTMFFDIFTNCGRVNCSSRHCMPVLAGKKRNYYSSSRRCKKVENPWYVVKWRYGSTHSQLLH
jgi:hypothetical protein